MTSYDQARANMVEGQLRTNKITDRALIEAFLAIPREEFVPSALRGTAYIDDDLPLGRGRYLMEPMVLGRLVQELGIRPTDAVLDVGCGSGYCADLLSRLGATVVAVESDPDLLTMARTALAGRSNVQLIAGPLSAGCAPKAPYDVILIAGAVYDVPTTILDQLAENGRLATVIAKDGAAMGYATLIERIGGTVNHRPLFDAGTPPLPEFVPAPAFTF